MSLSGRLSNIFQSETKIHRQRLQVSGWIGSSLYWRGMSFVRFTYTKPALYEWIPIFLSCDTWEENWWSTAVVAEMINDYESAEMFNVCEPGNFSYISIRLSSMFVIRLHMLFSQFLSSAIFFCLSTRESISMVY